MSAPLLEVEYLARVLSDGHPIVLCQVQHFLPSGMPVADLIATIRPQLETMLYTVAALLVDVGPMQRPLALGFDVGRADPEISITVLAPHFVLANLDDYLRRAQVAVAQFADRNIAPNARASGAGAG
jgi:hypothetical protein